MRLNIFCAKCGSELVQAEKWVTPLSHGILHDERPIALEPCPICANESHARSIAKKLLQDAIDSTELSNTEKGICDGR